MPKIQNVGQTENGPRYAQVGEYEGQKVEVATGYDANEDRWRYHVYLLSPSGGRLQIVEEVGLALTMEQAFDEGFLLAQRKLDLK